MPFFFAEEARKAEKHYSMSAYADYAFASTAMGIYVEIPIPVAWTNSGRRPSILSSSKMGPSL